jgi:hypothetical protein
VIYGAAAGKINYACSLRIEQSWMLAYCFLLHTGCAGLLTRESTPTLQCYFILLGFSFGLRLLVGYEAKAKY